MDQLKIKGRVNIQVWETKPFLIFWRKKTRLIQETGFEDNTITNAGRAQIALLAGDASAVPFTYLALGTSSTAPAVTDTALGAEIVDTGLARAAATVSRVTTSVTNDTLNLNYSWTASGAKTIQEIGIFNASSAGTMLGHKLTGAIITVNTNVINITYTVQFS